MGIDTFEKLPLEKRNAILQAGIAEFSRKAYSDASTDEITRQAGISKGLLFHYFGSKKAFYLACLRAALDRLIAKTPDAKQDDFFGIIFFVIDERFRLCRDLPAETLFVNLAARDASAEIMTEKLDMFAQYRAVTTKSSLSILSRALATLPLKHPDDPKLLDALFLYVHAINQKFLIAYRETPQEYFTNADRIKREMKDYILYLLDGIVQKEKE